MIRLCLVRPGDGAEGRLPPVVLEDLPVPHLPGLLGRSSSDHGRSESKGGKEKARERMNRSQGNPAVAIQTSWDRRGWLDPHSRLGMNGDAREVIGFNHTCAGVVDKGGDQHVVVVVRRVAMRRLVTPAP